MNSNQTDNSLDLAATVGRRLVGQDIVHCERIGAGKNSRVFKLTLARDEYRVIKFYFSHPSDTRDRLGVEYQALSFLQSVNVRRVPRPLAKDDDAKAALYTFIEGAPKTTQSLGEPDLDEALAFLKELKLVSGVKGADKLPDASEASFSLPLVVESLERRLRILEEVKGVTYGQRKKFREILASLRSLLNEVRFRSETNLKERGSRELSMKEKTLSPSDFGFHNALFGRSGWNFLDFEYFGWDDPGKLISDFILHPAMQLERKLQKYFVGRALQIFSGDAELLARLPYLYSLYGIKWCAIILNEFVPEYRARRGFASRTEEDLAAVLDTQLTKAERLLDSVERQFHNESGAIF